MAGGNVIGVTQWSLDAVGPEALEAAADLGFTAIQIDSGSLDGDLRLDDPGVRERYREVALDTGVAIVAVAAGDLNDLGLTSPAGSVEARRCLKSIDIAIDGASALGAPLVFLPSFRAGEIHDDAGLRRTAEVLRDACDRADGRPVTIATETTLDADGHLRLIGAAGRPTLRVLLDTQNPSLWGHTPAALVESLWPYLAGQVHVKDGRDGRMGNAVLGEGESDFAATATTLRVRGYAGALISENDYHGERRSEATRDIAVLEATFGGTP